MRDGVDHAAIDEAEPRRREARRDAIPIRTIDIKVHRRAAIARRALFVDERYRHRRAVAPRPGNQIGFIPVVGITGVDHLPPHPLPLSLPPGHWEDGL